MECRNAERRHLRWSDLRLREVTRVRGLCRPWAVAVGSGLRAVLAGLPWCTAGRGTGTVTVTVMGFGFGVRGSGSAAKMAELAVERAATNEVRTLAEGIAATQGPEIERMTSWLETWGENPAPAGDMAGMDHSGMDMGGLDQDAAMEELQSLSGTKFDRRFLELMTEHHRGAVEMAEAQLRAGQNPEALELAQQIIDDQTTEIALMATMLEDL